MRAGIVLFDSIWWFGVNFLRCLLYSVIVLFLLTLTMIFFIAFRTIRWLVHNRCLMLFDRHYGPFHLSLSRHFLQLRFLNLIFVFLTPKSFSTNCARIQHKRWSTLRISMALTVYNSMNFNIKYNRNIKRKTKLHDDKNQAHQSTKKHRKMIGITA